jgi:hypothetical protein
MPTTEAPEILASPLSLPLPRFRQPIRDPDLPEATGDPGPETAHPRGPETAPPADSRPDSPDGSPAPPPVLSPEAPARTRTSSAGDAKVASQVVAGLVALACGIAYGLFGRRGLHFRQPTERQIDDFAVPLGAILARHLPTEVISRDLVDATAAAGAAHRYTLDGPLVTRYAEPIPEDLP